MKVLFDTNIIIDTILEREPFFNDSRNALNKSDGFIHQGYILASTFTDIYYICKAITLHSNFSDFEDAVQSASAELNQVDLIVSRNVKDFIGSKITTLSPTEFLEKYKQ